MTVHVVPREPVAWVSARKKHYAFTEYDHIEGTTSEGKALLIGNDSVVAIEGTRQELLDYIEQMRSTVAGADNEEKVP